MTYALIQNDTFAHVGPLPRIWWDGTRWHGTSATQAVVVGDLGAA